MKATIPLCYEGHAEFAKIPALRFEIRDWRFEIEELLDTYHSMGLELIQSWILFHESVLSKKPNIKLCKLYLRFLKNFRNREQASCTWGLVFLS
jgi:hypothetical protein